MSSSRRATARRLSDVLARLQRTGRRANVVARAYYGITAEAHYGLTMPQLRRLGREIGTDHVLALDLWSTRNLDARVLATLVDDPSAVTPEQMEEWAADFDSWAICDGACQDLFTKTPFAHEKALAWSHRPEEFVKRAGFALMAKLAVHDRAAPDARFRGYLRRIRAEADDERRYVRKGVNWALREIGKRNAKLRIDAVRTARAIARRSSSAARWIASDALRELESEAVRLRVRLRPVGTRRRAQK